MRPTIAGAGGIVQGCLYVAVYVAAVLCGMTFETSKDVTIVWPAAGVVLAFVVRFGPRVWPVVVIADLLSNALVRLPWGAYPFIAAVDVLTPLGGAWMLTHIFGFRMSLDRVQDVLSLFLVSVVLGAVSGVIGVGGLYLFGDVPSFTMAWTAWFMGDIIGTALVAPLLFAWAEGGPIDWRPRRWAEAVAVFVLLGLTAILDFSGYLHADGGSPLLFAIFPFIVWIALRFGLRGATLGNLIVAGVAIVATSRGIGPFARDTLFTSLLYLHSFSLVVVMTSLLLGSASLERTRAREFAERKAGELTSVLSSITEGIFVCDVDERLTLSNPAARRMTTASDIDPGLSIDTAARVVAVRDADGEPLAHDDLPLVRALAGNVVETFPMTVCDQESGRDVHLVVSAAPIIEGREIVGAVAVSRDVTEEVKLERMKDEFLSIAAHELKTPVTVQKVAAQSLLREGTDERMRSRLEAINRGADRIHRIVQDMLDVSQIQLGEIALHVSRLNLPGLVRRFIDDFARQKSSHRFVVTAPATLVIDADGERVEQVLRNLLENATTYAPAGSTIEVTVEPQGPFGIVSVLDHGAGIAREKQSRIFERFYRAHAQSPLDRGGLGIGLFVSRELVHKHGGHMWFRSEPEHGSSFSFSLPLHAAQI
ncbi:Sensor histidine kinase [Labilithrix luteola]|uniref:histidine kinase n=1 Tax=Labilithrix luteola TaxID=1391654 RepID=A0A0K1Q9N8_9BACT|nr:MASE1 domain-containing protein [Labilithrix luteola]AKV02130.1 Sensor histidine kinase [Labilithrix luteola]